MESHVQVVSHEGKPDKKHKRNKKMGTAENRKKMNRSRKENKSETKSRSILRSDSQIQKKKHGR